MKHVKRALLAGAAVLSLLVLSVVFWVVRTLADLPDVSVLKRYRPPAATEVLDRNGALLAHFYDKQFRLWVPLEDLSDAVVQSVVTAEDDMFFGHRGVNYRAVWDALKHDVRKKRFARGGSTITQQMIKNVLLTKEKTMARKLREFVLARRAEEVLTKRRILEIYLNEVEWGSGIFGIEAASRFYFDKQGDELTWAEAALLAGMLPNPRYFDPFVRLEKARLRQEQVLFNLFQAKLLTGEEYAAALEEPLALRDPSSKRFAIPALADSTGRPCHEKALEQALLRYFGERRLYREGLRIGTTLDRDLEERVLANIGSRDTGAGKSPARVLIIREGMVVRGLMCDEDEDRVREYLASLPTPGPSYAVLASLLEEVDAGGFLASGPAATEPGNSAPTLTGPIATAPP